MSLVFDAQEVDAHDRIEFVRHTFASSLVPVEIQWPDRVDEIVSRASITDLGDVTLCSGHSSALRCERTPALARDSAEPCIFVNIQIEGTTMVTQHGRQVISHPGELVIYDSTAPYTIAVERGLSGDCIRIPHSALALPHNMIRQISALPLSPGHPIAAFTFDYLRRLATDRKLVADPSAYLLGYPSVELVRALVATHLDSRDLAATSLANSLPTRVLEYVRAHLHDPDLSGEQIAAAHHISVRYLYKVMADIGISLADWIRNHRLEAVRRYLVRVDADVSIAAVARRHGFTDMSSFSRSFRAKFGLAPREWRQRIELRSQLHLDPQPANYQAVVTGSQLSRSRRAP